MLTTINVKDLVRQQRQFFASGKTKDINYRLEQLQKLLKVIIQEETAILAALKADLRKPEFEGYFEMTVIQELKYAIKHLKSWTKPQKVKTPLEQFPSSATIVPEPLGIVLIIGPWNYPFSLMIAPLIGAIAAGNCALLKPSEIAPHTSKLLVEIISNTFDPNYIHIIEGGVETTQELLAEKFDHIFFTGGTNIGRIVMQAAAKHLTPVTLELGGKSPCIVDKTINLKETAKRLTWGKFINSGQTCIAPDYLLVHESRKEELLQEMVKCVEEFYGQEPYRSPDYARIISPRQFHRLQALLKDQKILVGGVTKEDERYIAPTILDEVSLDSPVMQEEIFGPILPVLEYHHLQDAIDIVNNFPKPLALYIFSTNKDVQEQIIHSTSSGGVCVNDTVMHVGVIQLPFGGVGDSGIGKYHGKASFDTFSHYKSILNKSFRFELNWRYAPYGDRLQLLKKLIK